MPKPRTPSCSTRCTFIRRSASCYRLSWAISSRLVEPRWFSTKYAGACPSNWLHKLAYVLRVSLRYPHSEGDYKSPSSPRKRGPRAADRGMSEKRPCVYILASKRNGTLYVGVTSDIARRAWQHRLNAVGGFVRDYGVHRLVFVEFHETMADAFLR